MTVLTHVEAAEARALLEALTHSRTATRRTTAARLRRLGIPPAARATRGAFDADVAMGSIRIDDAAASATRIVRQPPGRVFRVSVGVTGKSVDPDWDAFDQRYQWFGKPPQQVTSGAHLFVLAVDRWSSACVGLYEAVSAGAERLPGSPNSTRWPFALGVRPLAAIPPPEAIQIDGQRGPQSGLPERIFDTDAIDALYTAIAASSPPPGPRTAEQRVQELEAEDLAEDVLAAVRSLGAGALRPAIIERAVEIGEWTDEELRARAWFTGSGTQSHVRLVLGKALDRERLLTGRLQRAPGGRFTVVRDELGTDYRAASSRMTSATPEVVATIDLAALEKATKRHMRLQDALASALADRMLEVRSPGASDPQFDLAFRHDGTIYVVEVKSGEPVSHQQARLGCGQVLEYCHLLRSSHASEVRPVLLFEQVPPAPWPQLATELGVALLDAGNLAAALQLLLDA